METVEAVELINGLIREADSVRQNYNTFDAWRRRCRTVLDRIFGSESQQSTDLMAVNFRFYGMQAIGDNTPDILAFENGLEQSKEVLRAIIWEIERFGMPTEKPSGTEPTTRDPRNVFIVHGRNLAARDAMFALIRAVDLNPLEWEVMVQKTGKATPYIGEVLKKGFEIAQATIVLMTPDDEARLIERLRQDNDEPHEKVLTAQPRPNVILEAGMALGMNEERTVIVEFGRLRPISDLLGRHAVRMTNTSESRQKLILRLKTAGCDVKEGIDWLKAGDFDAVIESLPTATPEVGQADVSAALDFIEGLSPDELYQIGMALRDNKQTIRVYRNDLAFASLAHKGLVEKIPWEGEALTGDYCYMFPMPVWRELCGQSQSLLERAIAANSGRQDRLDQLQR